jgi:hypothetical protein
MTKKQFIDYIKALLPRIDKTGKYHSQVVAYTVERAVNNILCDLYLRSPQLIDPYIKSYTGIEFSENEYTGLWEADLPASYVPLPVVGSGVREVASLTDLSLTFVPVTYEDLMRTIDLDVIYVSSMVNYAVVDDKLIFAQEPSEYSEMRVRMLTSFTDYDDTDQFIVPYGQDMAIIQNIYQILGLVQPVDLYTNNSDYGRNQRSNDIR